MIHKLVVLSLVIAVACAMEGIVSTLSGGGYPHVGEVEVCLEDSAGMDGSLDAARFNYPWGIVYDREKSSIFVADCGCPDTTKENDRIRKLDLNLHEVSTVAGSRQGYKDGSGIEAQFTHTSGMILHQSDQKMYIADSGNDVIRVMDLNTNEVATFASRAGVKDFADGPLNQARFNNPQHLELHESTTRLFIADTDNHAIRFVWLNETKPRVQTITGGPKMMGFQDGLFSAAKFQFPTGMAYDFEREVIYVSDHFNHAVRKVDLRDGIVTTVAGIGSPGGIDSSLTGGSVLNYPEGIVHDPMNDVLYVAEFGNNCIRMISLSDNSVHVLAGGAFGTRDAVGRDAQFYHPTDLDFDPVRKLLYVTDQYNHRIRTVTALGNTEVAHPARMVIQHIAKVDAYRDLTVHNRFALATSFFGIVALVISIAVLCIARRWRNSCPSRILRYRKLVGQHSS